MGLLSAEIRLRSNLKKQVMACSLQCSLVRPHQCLGPCFGMAQHFVMLSVPIEWLHSVIRRYVPHFLRAVDIIGGAAAHTCCQVSLPDRAGTRGVLPVYCMHGSVFQSVRLQLS